MRSLTVLLILLSAPGLASAQAGRFLLAVGDVAVARGQAEIRAATGMPVQSGDTIRVGPASNAQIRMTDESIVGLRPGTVFRIDAYEYSGQAEPRSIFSLLKGGFRTVTGAIGRLHAAGHLARGRELRADACLPADRGGHPYGTTARRLRPDVDDVAEHLHDGRAAAPSAQHPRALHPRAARPLRAGSAGGEIVDLPPTVRH